MITLRDHILAASNRISIYKKPNIEEEHNLLNELIRAAGLGCLNDESIICIDLDDEWLTIETEWSARGSLKTSNYQLPSFIIDAEDPIAEATKWGLEKKIEECEDKLSDYKSYVEMYEKKILFLKEQLKTAGKNEN
jgi:hypothetical protein